MRGLERLTEERLPQALDVEAARESRLESVREVALAVADSAQGIADAVDELEPRLDPAARAQFVALADALGARARDLASDVRGLSGATLEERFDELHTVCDRCHAQFRLPR